MEGFELPPCVEKIGSFTDGSAQYRISFYTVSDPADGGEIDERDVLEKLTERVKGFTLEQVNKGAIEPLPGRAAS